MAVQSVNMGSMFSWVTDSFKFLKRHFATLVSASALTLGLGMLIALPMYLIMFTSMREMQAAGVATGSFPTGGAMIMFWVSYAVTIVLSLILFPPILTGWFRMARDIDAGARIRALDILAPYRDGQAWMRSVGFAVLTMLLYLAVFAAFAAAFWGVISEFIQQVGAQEAARLAGTPPPPQSFPGGILLAYFLFLAVAMFLQFVYMVGFAEVSLRATPGIEAMRLAVVGVFRNALKLIVFLFLVSMLLGAVFAVVILLLGLVIGLLMLIHPALAVVVGLLFYIPFLLCMYPLMFVGGYLMWKSILGDSAVPADMETGSAISA